VNLDWQGILKRHPVFSVMDGKEVDYLIEVSDEKEYEKDDVVLREGERGGSIFIIGFGAVEVVLPWGGEQTLHLSTLSKGEVFGEMALFEKPCRRSATVIAAERCVLLEIDGEEFLTVARRHPEIVMHFIEKVTSRLRDIGDHVLKVKLRNMDERIETLNTRLDAELRAAGATLNATQTIFDQTSRRANEIIESAERSRTRLTTTASIIGTGITVIVAIFGYIGFSQLQDVTELKDDMIKEAAEIRQIKLDLDDLDIATMKEKVEEFDGMLPGVNERMEQLEGIEEQIANHFKKIVLPKFRVALREDLENAKKMYRALLQMQDDGVTNEMFEIINSHLATNTVYAETDDKNKADTGEENKDTINMLETDIDGYKKTPRQELLSYFARLLSHTMNDEREQFDRTLKRFEKYAKGYQGSSIKEGLPFGVNDYEIFIPPFSSVDDEDKTSVDDEDKKRKMRKLEEDKKRKISELERVWDQIP